MYEVHGVNKTYLQPDMSCGQQNQKVYSIISLSTSNIFFFLAIGQILPLLRLQNLALLTSSTLILTCGMTT